MHLIYLKEGRDYGVDDLYRLCGEPKLDSVKDCFDRLSKVMSCDQKIVSREGDSFTFWFVGLYDYLDEKTGVNLTFFFFPKFVSDEEFKYYKTKDGRQVRDEARNAILLAIDRCHKEMLLPEICNGSPESVKESLLELAVRFLRDYLENGVYIVHRRELEQNGQGEIDWDMTIDKYQPVFLKRNGIGKPRPFYIDTSTELALSDANHYITRLHQCLVTTWGRKLEELGLSSVLRVNVPLLSEDDLDWFGDADVQLDQIRKEMNVQFVTKSRHTLTLMKELIERSSSSKTDCREQLSFGMNKVEHLWEFACAAVLGSELDMKIQERGLKWNSDISFRGYMPKAIWTQCGSTEKDVTGETNENVYEMESEKKSAWRLDFIRTWPSDANVKKLVILDAKYYDVRWENGKLNGQPGIGDITKQIFYQMAFEDLCKKQGETEIGIVNAFLFPENGKPIKDERGVPTIRISESVVLGWGGESASAFEEVNLFAVRIPGIELFRRYAFYESGDDWFRTIVEKEPKVSCSRGIT